MRELDLETNTEAHAPAPTAGPAAGGSSLAVIGSGRAGMSFASALSAAGYGVSGPLRRGEPVPDSVDLVLICVPDSAVADVAARLPEGPLAGHCCGAHGPELIEGRRSFCVHPLMTLTGRGRDLDGAFAAVAGSDPDSLMTAQRLALAAGMRPIAIGSDDRSAYHAAASVASNFLVTLEAAAERIAATAGLPRDALVPLVERTVSNWASLGPERSLTGPVARGDVETVARQRLAVESRCPDLLPLFDQMCDSTGRLASRMPA